MDHDPERGVFVCHGRVYLCVMEEDDSMFQSEEHTTPTKNHAHKYTNTHTKMCICVTSKKIIAPFVLFNALVQGCYQARRRTYLSLIIKLADDTYE